MIMANSTKNEDYKATTSAGLPSIPSEPLTNETVKMIFSAVELSEDLLHIKEITETPNSRSVILRNVTQLLYTNYLTTSMETNRTISTI